MTENMREKLKIILSILHRIQKSIFIDYGANYQNSIFLAGTGRSGTTWLSDIINYKNEYRYIFEPFYNSKLNICNNFTYKQYLRPDNRDKKYIIPAQLILTGKIRNYWTDSHNRKIIANKRLIKDIRANFLLKWLFENFPGIKIILALRHPCAVANSRIKLKWDTLFEKFLFDEELAEDFLSPFVNDIKKAGSDFEKQIFLWCVENYVPLKQFKKDDIHLAFYENFCINPRHEVERLFSFLNIRYDDEVFVKLKIPSSTSREESAINKRLSLVDNWRKHITREQIQIALDILKLFELDKIYTEDSMPNIESAYDFMSKK